MTGEQLIQQILDLNEQDGSENDHAIMATWAQAIRSGENTALYWISQNRNAFEQVFIRRPDDETEADLFRTHHFKLNNATDKPVFVCAMPKSGSTSFSRLLAAALGTGMASGHNRSSPMHAMDIDYLRAPILRGQVIHSHLLPSVDVLALLKALNVTPVVVLRNVFDALESRWRHERDSILNSLFELPVDLESIVHQFAFDYLRFASLWLQVCEARNWPVFYFEDNVADWRSAIETAITAIGEPVRLDRLDSVIRSYQEAAKVRPAEFRIGDGQKSPIPDHLADTVLNLAKKFQGADLSRVLQRER